MPVRRSLLVLAVLVFAASVPAQESRAQNIFDFLFGGGEAAHPAPTAPREQRRTERRVSPRKAPPRVRASLRVGDGGGGSFSPGGAGFCVRACDGYFFPAPRQSGGARQQSCEYACPSAAVEFYSGYAIEDARNAKGEKYSRLPTAFSFRDKRVAACTCNRPETSEAFFVRISRTDPTLKEGDVLMQPDGALVYHDKDFTPVRRASFLPSWTRDRLKALLDQARRQRPSSAADPTPTGVTKAPKSEAKADSKPSETWVSPQ